MIPLPLLVHELQPIKHSRYAIYADTLQHWVVSSLFYSINKVFNKATTTVVT